MATTNFLQINPTAAGQETDVTYAADTQRLDGFATSAEVPAALFNKMWFQASTFVCAFANMLVNKGYSTSDAVLSTLEAALAVIRTTADGSLPVQLLSVSSGTHSETLVPYGLWQIDDRAGNVIINLAATYPGLATGFRNTFKKIYGSANTITINVYSGENIDGSGTSYTLTAQGQAVTMVADGAADLWIESAYAGV